MSANILTMQNIRCILYTQSVNIIFPAHNVPFFVENKRLNYGDDLETPFSCAV